jgi:hypothetical protein
MTPIDFIKYLNGRKGWHGKQYRAACGRWLAEHLGTDGTSPDATASDTPRKSFASVAVPISINDTTLTPFGRAYLNRGEKDDTPAIKTFKPWDE